MLDNTVCFELLLSQLWSITLIVWFQNPTFFQHDTHKYNQISWPLLETCNFSHLIFYFIFPSTCVGSAWSFGFFIPATAANDLRLRRMFYPRLYPLHLFSYLNSWERASISLFNVWVLNKGTTGTIFIASLVWCGPCLGIEPGTSPHSKPALYLSRRRYSVYDIIVVQVH